MDAGHRQVTLVRSHLSEFLTWGQAWQTRIPDSPDAVSLEPPSPRLARWHCRCRFAPLLTRSSSTSAVSGSAAPTEFSEIHPFQRHERRREEGAGELRQRRPGDA